MTVTSTSRGLASALLLCWLLGCGQASGDGDAATDARNGGDGSEAPDAWSCSWSAPPAPFDVFCTPPMIEACDGWARSLGPGAIARCGPMVDCVGADRCEGMTCTCGAEPACGDHTICARTDTSFTCVPCP